MIVGVRGASGHVFEMAAGYKCASIPEPLQGRARAFLAAFQPRAAFPLKCLAAWGLGRENRRQQGFQKPPATFHDVLKNAEKNRKLV